ncbi:MAG: hypothetical protein JSR37_07235 [Verrucomicrobia bacterium]|nr:hypothetical protein [Verrucomicrobiota bacterium]MBS0636281.1 hypothetical protein [Verrucomicrobiota bacterium]
MFTSAINTVKETLSSTATVVADRATAAVRYAGRTVENLTNKVLGETGGKIARAVAYSLPAAVAYTVVPTYVKGLALATYLAAHVVYDIAAKGDLPLSKNLYSMITTGVGVSHLYMAAREAMKAVAKQAVNPVVATLVHVGVASFMISKAVKAPVPTFGSYGVEPTKAQEGETPFVATSEVAAK